MPDEGRRVGGEEPGEQWRRIFPAQVIQHDTSFTFQTSFLELAKHHRILVVGFADLATKTI